MKFFSKIAIILIFFLVISNSLPLKALATAGQTPFGGFSVYVLNCTCSNNYLIFHIPPVAGPSPIIYQPPASVLYPFSNIKESGNWILGNVSAPVPCVVHIGGHCIHVGNYPMITIVGTSDKGKIARSEAPGSGDDGSDGGEDSPAPPDDEELPPPDEQPATTTPAGPCDETPAENGQTEAETRSDLAASGVQVDPALSSTLSPVGKLPNNAIGGMKDLKRDCGPSCTVLVTSGARQPGNPTPPGSHGTGRPVFDLNKDKGAGGLDEYIKNNSTRNYTDGLGTHYVMPNGDEYLDENYGATGGTGAHWHVRINADHCSAVA